MSFDRRVSFVVSGLNSFSEDPNWFLLSPGSINVWDFGSGQLYKKYPDEHAKKRYEDTITDLTYHTMYNKRCLLVSSWGKKIRIMEVKKDLRTLALNFSDITVVNTLYSPCFR